MIALSVNEFKQLFLAISAIVRLSRHAAAAAYTNGNSAVAGSLHKIQDLFLFGQKEVY